MARAQGRGESRRPAPPGRSPVLPRRRPAASSRPNRRVPLFVRRLTREETVLLVLKRELYEGRWDEMEADLRARLEGRPYIFKLVHRIADDLERIARLRAFEQRHGVDLSEYVKLPS